ncbi:MAG TPA: glycine cleavage system protein GcvH [Firmicutes bacterium]|nr:glycine cleavage system protein GcvH [Bacillota bacterium]
MALLGDHAQNELGDITFVELPEAGSDVAAGEVLCTVESVKAVAEVYAPIALKVAAVNDALEDAPETINEDAEGKGWMVQVEPADPADLDQMMDADAYAEMEK